MGNFKVCSVVLAIVLPSYVQLEGTNDPCAVVRCADGYDCVASFDDCKYDDIRACTATPKCVSKITTGAPSVTPASSWEDPCNSFICKEGEKCFAMYHTCETGTCPPTPVCVPTFEEAEEDDVSESPSVTPASSWEDPCDLVDCKDGEKCHSVYHTCETGTCPPTAVCVPTFEEVEENDEDPPVTPASSWEDPCNLIDCKDGESCHTVFHTCETGTTCPPSGVCVPMF